MRQPMTDTAKMTAVELRERLDALAAGQQEIIVLLYEIRVKQIVDATTNDVSLRQRRGHRGAHPGAQAARAARQRAKRAADL